MSIIQVVERVQVHPVRDQWQAVRLLPIAVPVVVEVRLLAVVEQAGVVSSSCATSCKAHFIRTDLLCSAST